MPKPIAGPREPALHSAPYTVDDIFAMPDDGNRYEVLAIDRDSGGAED